MRSFLLLLVFALGCTKTNPNVCCTDDADCNAKGIPVGSICAAGLVCRGNQCISEPCTSAAQCDAATPYCVEQLCAEACTDDTQCPGAGEPADSLFCVAGACAACRDSADCPTPSSSVCDAGACRACAADAECSSGLCDAGTCIGETSIVYVSPTGSASSDCSRANPCTLDRAWAVVSPSRNNMKLLPGVHTATNSGTGDFHGGYTATVYGPATIVGLVLVYSTSSASSVLRLRELEVTAVACDVASLNLPVATVELDRVTVSFDAVLLAGAASSAISMTRCILNVTGSDIVVPDVTSAAIVASGNGGGQGQVVTIDRSRISIPTGTVPVGIAATDGASVKISNSVLRGGSTTNGFIAVNTSTKASSVEFSTFYNAPLRCPTGNLILASRNNIFLSDGTSPPADSVSGTSCSHNYDLIRPQATAPSGANNILNMDPRFANAAAGDFHLTTGSPAIDTADPSATDAVDFEGTARPQGARRDIGAFEYK